VSVISTDFLQTHSGLITDLLLTDYFEARPRSCSRAAFPQISCGFPLDLQGASSKDSFLLL
jgi:hypothetical protein